MANQIEVAGKKPAENKNYSVTAPSGKVYVLRALPKHYFLFYGELPTSLSEKAVEALSADDKQSFGEELMDEMTPEQLGQAFVFVREAVKYAMVKPRLTLTPTRKDDLSPFEMPEEDFNFISLIVVKGGGQANNLSTFRGESEETPSDRVGS